MTEREKMIKVLRDNIEYELRDYPNEHYVGVTFNYGDIADALIAAGIGDVKETERRAEVAERALLMACVILIKDEEDNVNMELLARVVYTMFLRKAEKELAGEKNEQV